jgi:hypothetical protein
LVNLQKGVLRVEQILWQNYGVISVEEMKIILADDTLSDDEVKEIRDGLRALAEVIFEKWQQDTKNKKVNNN